MLPPLPSSAGSSEPGGLQGQGVQWGFTTDLGCGSTMLGILLKNEKKNKIQKHFYNRRNLRCLQEEANPRAGMLLPKLIPRDQPAWGAGTAAQPQG